MASSSNEKSFNPSSIDTGFFQRPPKLENQFYDDLAFIRVFKAYLPASVQAALSPEFRRFGALVLRRDILELVSDAERNPPTLASHDAFGKRHATGLKTSHGWQELQKIGIKEGIVAIPYEDSQGSATESVIQVPQELKRVYQFLKLHIWSGSAANVACPSAMTDGAASLLKARIEDPKTEEQEKAVFRRVYARLVSRNPDYAWTSGQWMTERPGGSDVRETETIARKVGISTSNSTDLNGCELGEWAIDGFKWFSSATDANIAVLLAQSPGYGLSAFLVPLRKRVFTAQAQSETSSENAELEEPNGIFPVRLKPKLGTRPVPTAELLLQGARAHLVGSVGEGTKQISTILNITRIYTAIGALGGWGRGLSIARAYARVRTVANATGRERRPTLLIDIPVHVRSLATQTVDYWAGMQVGYFTVSLMGRAENRTGSADMDPDYPVQLYRLLPPLVKASLSLRAVHGLRACMEALGGQGYMENDDAEGGFNVARLMRDGAVNSIWEGTTDVLGMDVVRVLKGKEGWIVMRCLEEWISRKKEKWRKVTTKPAFGFNLNVFTKLVDRIWHKVKKTVETKESEELRYGARDLMVDLIWLLEVILLVEDALRDGDAVALEVARRWIKKRDQSIIEEKEWREEALWDRRIVFGVEKDVERGGSAKEKL